MVSHYLMQKPTFIKSSMTRQFDNLIRVEHSHKSSGTQNLSSMTEHSTASAPIFKYHIKQMSLVL